MKLLVCGSRECKNRKLIKAWIKEMEPDSIITGGARGADGLAEEVAALLQVPSIVEYAQWSVHGKAAGAIRNQKMLDDHKPDRVLAFYKEGAKNRGTEDMVRRANARGVPVTAVWEEE